MASKSIFQMVKRPGRYLGQEYNSVQKDWDSVKIRYALLFPDLYEIGMSHQGLQILYHILNAQNDILAERCFCPDIDAEKVLLTQKQSLVSLESAQPLQEFDILGITLPYELCYTNILTILHTAGIDFYAEKRDASSPLILGGGACALNPEPVADFFDAILLGDSEEAILDVSKAFLASKERGESKNILLNRLAEIDGVYIPSHFTPQYDGNRKLTAVQKTGGSRETVQRRVVADLNDIEHLKKPLVPNARIVHDRLGIEVARGCTRGCRFCQAGITYRPVRERTPETIAELAKDGIGNSGFEELSLLSLSTGDYSCLEQVLPPLMEDFIPQYISVAMPSMRVGTLTPYIMEQIKKVRKTGFTLAPEAGSERLRRVINKGITEDELLSTCEDAFGLGWRVIKFYFMIGLPTEIKEDIDSIAALVKKAIQISRQGQHRGKKEINVSVGTFVPKPHTPFQWERQLTIAESEALLTDLKKGLPRRGANLSYHNPKVSYLEGVFSRGDRRLAKLIKSAWQMGARLDGWTEQFNLQRWQAAAKSCDIKLDEYLQSRDLDKPLPWDHLQTGVDLQFLKDELQKAKEEQYTPDCRYHACQECGLCDFKTIFPRVINRSKTNETATVRATTRCSENRDHLKYIVHYSRHGNIAFLGHLEILQVIFRALRRANVPLNFSQGFNPSPKVSFGPALPVGTESFAEFFIMDLYNPLQDIEKTIQDLDSSFPPGLKVKSIELHPGKMFQKFCSTYTIELLDTVTNQQKDAINSFLEGTSFPVQRVRKRKVLEVDIRPLIHSILVEEPKKILVEIISESGKAGIKPAEALKEILQLTETDIQNMKICKTNWKNL